MLVDCLETWFRLGVMPAAQAFLRQLAQSLEAAMQQHQEPGAGRKQVVHAVQLVRAIPFYGYHPDERLFIKIVLYNPSQVTRIATLLQVMLTTLQLQPNLHTCRLVPDARQYHKEKLYLMCMLCRAVQS